MGNPFNDLFEDLNDKKTKRDQEQQIKDAQIQGRINELKKRTDVIEIAIIRPVLSSLKEGLQKIKDSNFIEFPSDIKEVAGYLGYSKSVSVKFRLNQQLSVVFNIKDGVMTVSVSDTNQSNNNFLKNYDVAAGLPNLDEVQKDVANGLKKVIDNLYQSIM